MFSENHTEIVAATGLGKHIRGFCQLGVTLFQGGGHDGLGLVYLEKGLDELDNIGQIAINKTRDPFSNLEETKVLEKPTTGLGWIRVGMLEDYKLEVEEKLGICLQPTILDRRNCVCAVSTEDILEELQSGILDAISQYPTVNRVQELTMFSSAVIFVGTLSNIFVFVGINSKIPAHVFSYDESFFVSTNELAFRSWKGESKGVIEPGQVAVIQSDSIQFF